MTDRELLQHLLEAADRLSDQIIYECIHSPAEWLDMPAVRRIKGDAGEIQEAIAFVRKRLPVTSEEKMI